MVTWKADGTRYILVVDRGHVYLVDRKFDIVRQAPEGCLVRRPLRLPPPLPLRWCLCPAGLGCLRVHCAVHTQRVDPNFCPCLAARVPARFLEYIPRDQRKAYGGLKFGGLLPFTVLDGEMVVDEDVETGKFRRRYLIYDCMLYKGRNVMHEPFKERFRLIDEIMAARTEERNLANAGRMKHK